MGISDGFPVNPAKCIPLQRVDDIASDEAAELVERKRPFVGKVHGWRALEWDVPYFKEMLGSHERQLRRRSDGEIITVTVAELLDIADDPGWKSRYVPVDGGGPLFRINHFGGKPPEDYLVPLDDDYVLPKYIPSDAYQLGIMIRNSTQSNDDNGWYFTEAHWEHTAMPTLNMQVRGKKHLWLFSPEQSKNLRLTSGFLEPPFLSVGADSCIDDEHRAMLENAECHEVVLEPGDAVYWPEFWTHWFVHYGEFQINAAFYWQPENLELNPISATWAMSVALVRHYGGFEETAKALAAMPEEARQLLVNLEQTFFNEADLLSPYHAILDRRGRPALKADTSDYKAK